MSRLNHRIFSLRRVVAAMLLATFGTLADAKVPIKVSGLGWIDDREMRLALERLTGAREADVLRANAIEDAAVILTSALNDEGFQRPTIEIVTTREDGTEERFTFDPTFEHPVPRTWRAKALRFRIESGPRWRITGVRIEGLTVLGRDDGEAYFRSDAVLLARARANAYSKGRVGRSEAALLDELRRRGYGEAKVEATIEQVDERTGNVALRVVVHEGPRWVVERVEVSHVPAEGVTLPDPSMWSGVNATPTLEQDVRQALRLGFYHGGYPDVAVTLHTRPGPVHEGVRQVVLVARVNSGPRVTMGQARFEGNRKTRESVLQRRVSLRPGEPLNPVEMDRARQRISRLGVFESVDLRYEPAGEGTRDPVFSLKEGPAYETNLIMGYGSYEQLRGGVEYRQMNLFGLAHQSRGLLVQSMKSTRGEYTYTVPELFGESIDGAAKVFGLQRQEIAFQRQEYGATFSLRRALAALHGDATLGYTFEALRNRENALSTVATDAKQLNVASVTAVVTTDRRDNALRPHKGYHGMVQLELASPKFGGVAEYQRFEFSGSYHTAWGRGRWIHVGLSHGVITTVGADDDRNLPVNKRFFPGGDNSIRGYQMGEAAPRGADGRFLGAKSYALLNVELEQALTQTWSVVAFADALGNATQLRDYPFRERLYSVGLGLRYQTIVGPVRLEYGRNVNPRHDDPPGTWQVSIGFPF
ncbi:BamA/TamA family outer membrane protein [Opitutus sp. ER46]|uniref:BamA/OMP85 family outer membrane protein n=1 Tax=Opitutus sp. ER46 TaxID=2161864 RepID=UPI001304BC91|nr:BamA/TamA family outer membrane protein [Opitutus sp. ER46]